MASTAHQQNNKSKNKTKTNSSTSKKNSAYARWARFVSSDGKNTTVKNLDIDIDYLAKAKYLIIESPTWEKVCLSKAEIKKQVMDSVKKEMENDKEKFINNINITDDIVSISHWTFPTINTWLISYFEAWLDDWYKVREAQPSEYPDLSIDKEKPKKNKGFFGRLFW